MKRSIFTLLIWLWAVSAFSQQTIDPRILPPGMPRNVQVDGVNVPRTDPLTDPSLNFRDTSEIIVTNPSSGNIDMTINTGAVTDAKIAAGGITTRTKLPVAIVYDDETNTFTAAQMIGGAGSLSIMGSTSGQITIGRSAAAGTYNFNLPTSAGTLGLPLLSGGGGATPMSFSILGLAGGGTNQSAWTAGRCVQVNAAGTGLESAAAACGTGGAGNITLIQGTTNEIGVAGGTGPTATLSLPTILDLSAKILQGASPLKFEGATTNAFTTAVTITDPTANRTFTLPNANSVAVQPQTAGANSFVTGIDSLGVITIGQLDSDLIALAGNTGTGLWVPTGPGTGVVRSIACVANETLCTNGSGVAGNPTVGLAPTVVRTDLAATFGAFAYDFRNSLMYLPSVATDPATTINGRIALNTATGNLRAIVANALRSILFNPADCPAGPLTFTAANGSSGLGCGSYPVTATPAGTANTYAKFTTGANLGNSPYLTDDGTGVLIAGVTRLGNCTTNCLDWSFSNITGNKTRAAKNVSGDEVVSTGSLPVGNAAKFDASGMVIDGGVRLKTCIIENDMQSATPLANANITGRCDFDQASTILEIAVYASSGTPSVLLERWRPNGGAIADVLTGALATAAAGAYACSKTTAIAGIAGITCTNTLQNTALNAGDVVRVKSATAGGVATWSHVKVTASY